MAGSGDSLSSSMSLDSTDFKTGISAANRELRLLESGFKASTASMGDWSKSSDGLQQRIQSLNSQMEIQERKVKATSEEYKKVAAEKGATSRAAQELEIKLNRETESLGKMQKELNDSTQALDEMGDESEGTSKEVDKVGDSSKKSEKEAKKFGDTLKNLGKGVGNVLAGVGKAIAAVGAASVGAVTGLTAMVMKSADAAGELVDLSAQTGLTITQIQELDYVGKLLGLDVETITKSMGKFTNVIEGAKSGVGPMAEDMATLGVSVTDSNGVLRDSNDVYFEALNALGKLENETQKEIIAQNLFGKSYQELIPLINTSAEEMDALKTEAHTMGAVMDEDAVKGLESFGDELESLKMSANGMMGTISAAMLPTFQGMTGKAKGWMGELAGILSGSGGDMSKIGPALGKLLGTIFTDLAGKAPGMVKLGLGLIQGLLTALLAAMPNLIPAAIRIVTTLIEGISTMAVQLLAVAPGLIMQLVNGLVEALPEIVKSGTDVVLALVAGIGELLPELIPAAVEMIVTLITGIADAMPELMGMIAEIIPQVVITLIENLPLLIGAALELIVALVDGLVKALPVLVGYIPEIVVAIFDALVAALPMIVSAGGELITSLISGIGALFGTLKTKGGEIAGQVRQGISGALTSLWTAGSDAAQKVISGIGAWFSSLKTKGADIIGKVKEGITGALSGLWSIGKSIIDGVWKGIKDNIATFTANVRAFFKGIIDDIMSFLGINSPSKVWADEIGGPLAAGIGVGFLRGMGAVENQMKGAINGLIPAMGILSGDNVSIGFSGQTKANERSLGPVSIRVESPQPLDYELLAQLVARKINGSFA